MNIKTYHPEEYLEEIRPYLEDLINDHKTSGACKWKYNNERENQVILLMITDGEKWRYLALKSEPIFYNGKMCNRPVKCLSRLLRGKSSIIMEIIIVWTVLIHTPQRID